jgi:hypothetical protein
MTPAEFIAAEKAKLERKDEILSLIAFAIAKRKVKENSQFYKIFGTREEQIEDLIFADKVIDRIINYYKNQS